VWTWHGLVTYYTVFVIDLASRRVHILGSTPHPGDLFMRQIVRLATAADDGVLVGHRVLICDRDRKWSRAVRQGFGDAGIRVVLTRARPERECLRRAIRARSRRNASIEWFPWGSGISDAPSRSLSSTIISNGITKDSTIG
jgi:hypothetical protein